MSGLENLLSEDEALRKSAITELQNQTRENPATLADKFSELLKYIRESNDEFTQLQIGNTIAAIARSNPGISLTHQSAVISTIEVLARHPLDNDEAFIHGTAMHVLNILNPHFSTNPDLVKQMLPVLLELMSKKGSIKWSAYSPIATSVFSSPTIFEGYVDKLLKIIPEFTQLLMILPTLFNLDKQAFENNLPVLIEIYQKDPTQQTFILQICMEIAKEKPELVAPHVPMFIGALPAPSTGYNAAMVFAEVARDYPDAVYPFIQNLLQAAKIVNGLAVQVPNILGLMGRASSEKGKEIMVHLNELSQTSDQNVLTAVLIEMRNLTEMDKALIEPYIGMVRSHTSDPQETIRDQANALIDIYEGRDLKSLASQIEEQNKKIAEIVTSIEDLREYVDENLDLLKDFIAEVAKKLPVPVSFETAGRIRKTIILHFKCEIETERCLYPSDRTFSSESKMWNRWLKIAFSAVRIGKSVILPPNPGDAVKSIKDAYEGFKSKEDQDFLDYIKEPFLTSGEQDRLIEQLKDANFFNVFIYQSTSAGWSCIMCNPPSI